MPPDISVDTTGWLRGCGVPGCRWLLDPELPDCPEHNDLNPTNQTVGEVKAAYREDSDG